MSDSKWRARARFICYIDLPLSILAVLGLCLIIFHLAGFGTIMALNTKIPTLFTELIPTSNQTYRWIYWGILSIVVVLIMTEIWLSKFLMIGTDVKTERYDSLDCLRLWGIINVYRGLRDGLGIIFFGYFWLGLSMLLLRIVFVVIIRLFLSEMELVEVAEAAKFEIRVQRDSETPPPAYSTIRYI